MRTRVVDHFSGPTTRLTGAIDTEEALLEGQLSRAFTATTAGGFRALRRARATARFAALHLGNLKTRLASLQDVVEADLQVVTQIGAALAAPSPASTTPPASAEDVSKEIVEKIPKIPQVAEISPRMAPSTGPSDPGMPETVVASPLFGVRKDGIGLGHFLEALFGRRVIGIPVGVTFQRELAIGLLEVSL